MKRSIVFVTVAAMMLLAHSLVSGPAQAKAPGPNGQIAFLHDDPALPDSMVITVNPDGTHLAPVHLGEEVRWSPDGSRLAIPCCEDGDVGAILNPDTGALRVLKSPDPTLVMECLAWSPDAKRLACGAFGNGSRDGIYTIRTSDGRGLTRITSNPRGADFLGDWSPDGRRLVFWRLDPTRSGSANQAIFVVKLDGSGLRRITPWGSTIDLRAGWSPDGSSILFSDRGSLFTVRPDGTGLTKIVLTGIDPSSVLAAFNPTWSPDGMEIVFALKTAPPQGGTVQINIFTANTDGTGLQQVTHDTSVDFADDSPDWGPHPLAT